MKIKHYLLTAITALALAGCYDDDKLWNAVDEQGQRLETLEKWQKQVNSNIEALQTLVSGQDYITAVTPITQGDETIGYTIAFHTHAPITIYHGEKGDKGDKGEQGDKGDKGDAGTTPIVSVTKGEDGNWYWTLNGELLKDADGKLLRANGIDGTDGRPGQDGAPGAPGTNGQSAPTPQLKSGKTLNDADIDGNWIPHAFYLSVDGGKNWAKVSGDNGTNGDSWLEGIDTTSEDYVTFTLTGDGSTKIQVPRYKALTLAFTYTPEDAKEAIEMDPATDIFSVIDNIVINYTLEGQGFKPEGVRLSAVLTCGAGWTATVDHTKRSITIHSGPLPLASADLLVTATDNAGQACTYQLALQMPYGGKGTKDEPYTIASAEGLKYLSRQTNIMLQDYGGRFFKLTQDIDLKGEEWTPIMQWNFSRIFFKGTFDGDKHSIRGLKVNAKDFAGLFGYVEGTIKNITLLSPEVASEAQYCGALVCYCSGGTIENCYVKDGKCTSGNAIGGLIGYSENSSITNCHVDKTKVTLDVVKSLYTAAGGLIGRCWGGYNNLTGCSATLCTITAAGEAFGGGLIGNMNGVSAKVKACYATGTVTSSSYGGALVGRVVTKMALTGCYSSCTLTGQSVSFHELVGATGEKCTYKACYYLTSETDQETLAGVTYQTGLTPEMIEAMNKALGTNSKFVFNDDGTLRQK